MRSPPSGYLRAMQFIFILLALLPSAACQAASICYSTPGNGRLEGGVPLARSGKNFAAYSTLGVLLGRTHVHSDVARAYADLRQTVPDTVYVYGESGWSGGGSFRPHRTHQNGLSVDFMVPVRNGQGRSVRLPAHAFNKYGYGIEFDASGKYRELRIDFDAIADHLVALHKAAKRQGIGIQRMIFEPAYLPRLYEARQGGYIRKNISFMKGTAWIRHDEHYHVDFRVPCRPLKK